MVQNNGQGSPQVSLRFVLMGGLLKEQGASGAHLHHLFHCTVKLWLKDTLFSLNKRKKSQQLH